MIRVTTNGNITRTDVYDLITGEKYYLIRNDKDNTLYSSMTGKTVKLEVLENTRVQKYSIQSLYRSASGERYIKTVRISTRTLSNMMQVVSAASLIAAVVTAGGGKIVMSSLEYLLSGATGISISVLLNNNDYLVWDVYEVETSSVKGGKRYYYKMEKVKNIRFE